jgi:hypothetical protein
MCMCMCMCLCMFVITFFIARVVRIKREAGKKW